MYPLNLAFSISKSEFLVRLSIFFFDFEQSHFFHIYYKRPCPRKLPHSPIYFDFLYILSLFGCII